MAKNSQDYLKKSQVEEDPRQLETISDKNLEKLEGRHDKVSDRVLTLEKDIIKLQTQMQIILWVGGILGSIIGIVTSQILLKTFFK